jgi:hypothetical protein
MQRPDLIIHYLKNVVSDVLVDVEAPLVTSGISIPTGAQSFGGAHRVGFVYVYS